MTKGEEIANRMTSSGQLCGDGRKELAAWIDDALERAEFRGYKNGVTEIAEIFIKAIAKDSVKEAII